MSCLQREQTKACQSSAVLLQDQLTGALIGLAQAVVGNEDLVNEQTHQLIREALLMNIANADFSTEAVSSLMQRIAEEKHRLVPLCSSCDHPCGRNDDYDMSLMWNAEAGLCSLKSQLLFSIRGMAAYAYRAAALGCTDEAVDTFFLHALSILGCEWETDQLLPLVMKVGEASLRCMALLNRAGM